MNYKLMLAAGVALMLAFTIGCDGGGGGKEEKKDVSGNSSSSIDSSSDSSSSSGDSSSSSVDVSSSSVGDSSSSVADDSSSSVGDSSSSSELVIDGVVAVEIGEQTWMKKNLNVDVEGSKCYDNLPDNCAIYGRLYDFAMAMALDEECYTTECAGQIEQPHQGICPTGWHIPTNAEWDKLYRYADGKTSTNSPYESLTAGKDLKANSGWYSNRNGTDKYGFAALPGGYGHSNGLFYEVSRYGYWWSASEGSANAAYGRFMSYSSEEAFWRSYVKEGRLNSVRCVLD